MKGISEDLRIIFENWRNLLKKFLYLILAIYLFSGIYVVKTNEVGILKLFGKIINKDIRSGIHYHFPYPIENVDKIKVKQINRVELGFWPAKKFSKISESIGQPYCITGDENIAHLSMIIQYYVKDPVAYLYNVSSPEEILKNICNGEIIKVVSRAKVDEILTTAKHQTEQNVLKASQEKLNEIGVGIKIVSAELKNSQPPQDVIAAFQDVVNAQVDARTYINNATAYAKQLIPEAKGKADQIMQESKAYQEKKIAYAEGETKRFLEILKRYRKNKEITKNRLYLETMEKILPKIKKYTISSKEGKNIVNLKLFVAPSKGVAKGLLKN